MSVAPERGMPRSRHRQQGTVLLTVMLMVAVAAFIATEIAYRQKMDVLRTAAFLSRDAAFQYLMGAENIGIYALKEDLDKDNRDFKSSPDIEIQDDLGEGWNQKVVKPFIGGYIEGHLTDLAGRFNVNSLFNADTGKRGLYKAAFIKLLADVQNSNPNIFSSNVTPSMLVERVTDWLDPDVNPTQFDGMEDDEYFRKERPYRTANHFITDISELLLIDGFTPQAIDALEPYLSFLPPETPLNLYTADTVVLDAFGLNTSADSEFVNKQRPKQLNDKGTVSYDTKMELLNFLVDPTGATKLNGSGAGEKETGSTNPNINPDLFDIKSDYYLLEGKAVVNDRPVLIESVIWRPRQIASGKTVPDPPQVIIRKFVDPLK